jgi:hypothetical protein
MDTLYYLGLAKLRLLIAAAEIFCLHFCLATSYYVVETFSAEVTPNPTFVCINSSPIHLNWLY